MATLTGSATLVTVHNQVAALLVEITADPKPSYSVDGESYSWNEYFGMLTDRLELLERAIQRLDGPWEVVSRGIT